MFFSLITTVKICFLTLSSIVGVVVSVGYHPVPLLPKGKNVHLLGDCNKVGNVRSAIWGAWDIAMKI